MSERLLGRALRRERRAVRVATWSGLAVTFSTVALAATSAWLIVRAAQRPTVLSLTVPMGLVQLFALAKAASRYLERTQTHRAALRVMGHVRAEVARDLEPLLPAGLGPHSAEVVDRAIGDVERVQDLLTAVAGPLVTSVVAGLATIVVCGLLAPTTGLVVAAAMVLDAVVVPAALWRSGSRNATEVDATHEGLTVLFDEVAQSGDEFVMAGAGRALESRLADLEARWDENQRRRRRVTGLAAAATVLVNGLSAALLVMVSAQALRSGHLAPALIAVPVLAALAALELVSAIAPTVATAARDRAALARLEDLATRPWPVIDPRESQTLARVDVVTSEDVSVAYGDDSVLVDVDLRLETGDVVLIDGTSGGGKTTLARALVRFLEPTSGTVAARDVSYGDLSGEEVRRHVGYVDDAPHVFDTTLGENVRLARPEASDAQVTAALVAAGLGAFLVALPEGLATPLGGESAGLSGGEQRRLGVAREILSGRPVAIFDEPTEGLDEATARQVLAQLREHYRDGVLVVISHLDALRLEGSRHLRLEGGRLLEVSEGHGVEVGVS